MKSRRLVSLREFFKHKTKKAMLLSTGMSLGIFAAIGIASSFLIGVFSLLTSITEGVVMLLIALIVGALSIKLVNVADNAYTKGQEMEPVTPITRHNAVLLPTEETLVRASEQPTIEQEKELLRGATPTNETSPEELLRPLT